MLLEKCQLKSQLLRFAKNNTLCAPKRVMEEYVIGDSETLTPNLHSFSEVFKPVVTELDKELLRYFHFDSSSGEYWVIAYAHEHPEFCCVIDEHFARDICGYVKVKLTGTIGIIKDMKEQDLLTFEDLACIRKTIKNSRFYLSKELLEQLDLICKKSN